MKKDDVIFSKNPITEVADWGREKVALYSEDESLFNEFSKDEKCLNSQAYRRNGKWLAGDCYFKREYKQNLTKRLNRMGIIK